MMKQRRLGNSGLMVSAMGLGCMGMSIAYGERDDAESTRTIHRALDLGMNFLDTAEAYGGGQNEELIGKAIKGKRDKYVIATKFGNFGAGGSNPTAQAPQGTDYVRAACEKSLRLLGIGTIDLYYLHRVDKTNPIEDVIGAMARLRDEGKIRFLGISEAGPATLRRAHKTAPIAALQSEYSLWCRADAERDMLPLCRELDIAYVAYSPLGRGFLTSTIKETPTDRRAAHPRFQGDNLARNLKLLGPLERIAQRLKATPAQIALAWTLARGADVIPIPGTKRVKWLEENVGAAELVLTARDVADLDAAFPPGIAAGTRYPEPDMARVMV